MTRWRYCHVGRCSMREESEVIQYLEALVAPSVQVTKASPSGHNG